MDIGGQDAQRQAEDQTQSLGSRGHPGLVAGKSRPGHQRGGGDTDHTARTGRQKIEARQGSQAYGQQKRGERPGEGACHGMVERLAQQCAQAPGEGRKQKGQSRKAEGLQQKIGGGGAKGAEPVGNLTPRGVVEAGVGGRIADQRQGKRRHADQHQRAGTAHHQKRISRLTERRASAKASAIAAPRERG